MGDPVYNPVGVFQCTDSSLYRTSILIYPCRPAVLSPIVVTGVCCTATTSVSVNELVMAKHGFEFNVTCLSGEILHVKYVLQLNSARRFICAVRKSEHLYSLNTFQSSHFLDCHLITYFGAKFYWKSSHREQIIFFVHLSLYPLP